MSDCPGQTARVTSNLHSSSSTMAVSRVPSPPLPEVNTPVAENWCYTQVSFKIFIVCSRTNKYMSEPWPHLRLFSSMEFHSLFRELTRHAQGAFAVSFSLLKDEWHETVALGTRVSFLFRCCKVTQLENIACDLGFFLKLAQSLSLSKLNVTWKVNNLRITSLESSSMSG